MNRYEFDDPVALGEGQNAGPSWQSIAHGNYTFDDPSALGQGQGPAFATPVQYDFPDPVAMGEQPAPGFLERAGNAFARPAQFVSDLLIPKPVQRAAETKRDTLESGYNAMMASDEPVIGGLKPRSLMSAVELGSSYGMGIATPNSRGPLEAAMGAGEGALSGLSRDYSPPPTLRRLFGADDIVEGQQRGALERIGMEGRFRPDDPIVTPALGVRDASRQAVTNQATRIAAQARTVVKNAEFQTDELGRIPALGGIDPTLKAGDEFLAPTIRDVAARYPRYAPYLTPTQREAMEQLRTMVAPYRQALGEVVEAETRITGKPSSIKIGQRADVIEGGFYLPRGNAETDELADIAAERFARTGRRAGGKAGFEKSATFASESEGISTGYKYTPLDESMGSYVRGAGNRALDRHTANYFLTRVDETGKRLAESRADRIDPELRQTVESLRQRISGRIQTLRGRVARGGAEQQAARDAGRVAEQTDRLRLSAETRAILRKATVEEIDVSSPSVVREFVPDIETLAKRADTLRESAATGNRAAVRQLGETEALLDIRRAADAAGDDVDEMLRRVEEAAEQVGRYTDEAPVGRVTGAKAPAFGSPERVAWDANRRMARNAGMAWNVQRGASGPSAIPAPFEGPIESIKAYEDILTHVLQHTDVDVSRNPSTAAVIKAAERELRILSREARKAESRAATAGGRASRTAAAQSQALQEIDALRSELDAITPRYQRAQELAASTPRDQGTIPLAGLEAYSFPWEMADEAARALQRETKTPGEMGAELRAVNSLARGVQATGEMSYLGIQMAIGMVTDTAGFTRAAKAATKAWLNSGDEVMGNYLARFDTKAAQKGLPTAERWASSGLRLAESGTEFRLGGRTLPKAAQAVADLPGIKQALNVPKSLARRADRGFGVAGDTMRLELADTLAEESLLAGRTLDAAELKKIAESANRVTGWTPQRAFGDWGEAFNFAPRYLAARARTVGQLASADPRKRQLARRLVGRYVAIGTSMTVAANELRGEETDFRPFSGKNGPTYDPREAEYKNPNFIRVMNAAGRDWSLLGPVDSLLGVAVGAGSLLTNPTGDPKEALDRLRTVFTAPLSSLGLDWLVFGKNFDGEPLSLDSEAGIRDLMQRAVPFAGPQLGESAAVTADRAQGGDLAGAASEVVGGIGQGFIGGRGSRVTPKEQVQRGGFSDLNPDQQFKALPAESWRIISDPFKAEIGAAKNYYEWEQNLSQQLRDAVLKGGGSPGEAEEEVTKFINASPVRKAYLEVKNAVETQWVAEHPEEAKKRWDADARKPEDDRTKWKPTAPQIKIILAAR